MTPTLFLSKSPNIRLANKSTYTVLHDSESISFLTIEGKAESQPLQFNYRYVCSDWKRMDYWTDDLSQAHVTDH